MSLVPERRLSLHVDSVGWEGLDAWSSDFAAVALVSGCRCVPELPHLSHGAERLFVHGNQSVRSLPASRGLHLPLAVQIFHSDFRKQPATLL